MRRKLRPKFFIVYLALILAVFSILKFIVAAGNIHALKPTARAFKLVTRADRAKRATKETFHFKLKPAGFLATFRDHSESKSSREPITNRRGISRAAGARTFETASATNLNRAGTASNLCC